MTGCGGRVGKWLEVESGGGPGHRCGPERATSALRLRCLLGGSLVGLVSSWLLPPAGCGVPQLTDKCATEWRTGWLAAVPRAKSECKLTATGRKSLAEAGEQKGRLEISLLHELRVETALDTALVATQALFALAEETLIPLD
ncbi:hypothetical protein NDU88_000472 [Pleurodeles waltl]|uniref:Uncharacterized protein n=1 Tax=Pleurodeles waltl TaxID=8319 RepID=A0AAV7URZ9_PLEWA|nr:hypothetical protein NDU88_000472 [Pleurodeles waltl]